MRRAVGEVLRACLRGAPRKRAPCKERRQDTWQPGAAANADAQDGETARAEAAQEEREEEAAAEARAAAAAADGPEVWLARIDGAERAAVRDEGADDTCRQWEHIQYEINGSMMPASYPAGLLGWRIGVARRLSVVLVLLVGY